MTPLKIFNNQLLFTLQLIKMSKITGIIIILFCIISFAEDYMLNSVLIPEAPRINKEKNIFYNVDLIFNKCPPDYWINYNKRKEQLIIDFYGITIIGKPEIRLSGNGVFQKVTIENSETKLSLTGKGSKIIINIRSDIGWHFKATSINATTIRINAWKDISDLSIVEQTRRPVRFYVVLGSVLFILPLGVLLLLFID